MISTETIPLLLLIGLTAWLLSGLIVMAYGRKLPRAGDWLVSIPLIFLLAAVSFGISILSQQKFAPLSWMRGWVGPRNEVGSLAVGLLLDPLGAVISLLAGLIVALFLLNRSYVAQEKSPQRAIAALAVSGTGVMLSWLALTPWLVVSGLTLSIMGALFASGTRWESDDESRLAGRFAWERAWGLILAVIGLCVLGGARGAILFWPVTESWTPGGYDLLGSVLLISGLFVQLAPFPFLGSLLTSSTITAPIAVVTRQLFPASCALAALIRFEPALRSIGVFPAFGWAALGSALLTLAAGLVQREWRSGVAAWLASGLSVSAAALAFVGPRVATSFYIAFGLGATAFACAATTLESRRDPGSAVRGGWAKLGLVLAAMAGTGIVGFASAGGGVISAIRLIDQPAALGFFMLVVFMAGLLGWSLAWRTMRGGEARGARWYELITPVVLALLALGAVWTGTATGDAIIGTPDRLFQPLFDLFFGAMAAGPSDELKFGAASGVYWGATFIALIVAYSTSGGGRDSWANFREAFPRFSGFVGNGYGIDTAVRHILRGITRAGEGAEWLLDRRLWDRWVPIALGAGVRRGASLIADLDEKLGSALAIVARRGVEIPAKGLQLIQSGDVRWYLFFAIGSGLAILLNYMRI